MAFLPPTLAKRSLAYDDEAEEDNEDNDALHPPPSYPTYDERSMTFGALLSNAAYAYGTSEFSKMVPKNMLVDTDLSDMDATVFRSTITNRAYIAYRGTHVSNLRDISADLNIVAGTENEHARFHNALIRAARVGAKYGVDNLHVVGHSLGGTQALYVNARMGIPASAFNPGFGPSDLRNSSPWGASTRARGIGDIGSNATVYHARYDPLSIMITRDTWDKFDLVTIPAKIPFSPTNLLGPHNIKNFIGDDVSIYMDDGYGGPDTFFGSNNREDGSGAPSFATGAQSRQASA